MKKSAAPAGQSGSPARSVPAGRTAPTESAPVAQPRSVVIAVRLMYAGAVVTAIGLVISVIVVATDLSGLRASHPHASLAKLHSYQHALITVAIMSGLIEIALWLIMARANRAGARWARMGASVLFVLGTWNLASHFLGQITIGNIAYSAVTWLIGLAVIVLLWQRTSSEYFAAQTAPPPPSGRGRN